MTDQTLTFREWIAVYILRFSREQFERAPEHSAFERAAITSDCAGCVKVFKLLDGLAALHETHDEVGHFLTAMGMWWIHNMLKTTSIGALMHAFTGAMSQAGIPVATKSVGFPMARGGDRAH